MAFNIVKITVDGVTFTGCELTGTDGETAQEGVAEATVAAAPTGATVQVTPVASPTSSPQPGPSRMGISYAGQGPLARCAVCGEIYPKRQMRRQRGGYVDPPCYDERIPLRRTGTGLPRRGTGGV